MERSRRVLADLPGHVPPAAPLRHPGVGEARSILAEADEIGRDVIRGTEVDLGAPAPRPRCRPTTGGWSSRPTSRTSIGCVAGGLLTEDPTVLGEARSWLTACWRCAAATPTPSPGCGRRWRSRLREYPEAVRLLERA